MTANPGQFLIRNRDKVAKDSSNSVRSEYSLSVKVTDVKTQHYKIGVILNLSSRESQESVSLKIVPQYCPLTLDNSLRRLRFVENATKVSETDSSLIKLKFPIEKLRIHGTSLNHPSMNALVFEFVLQFKDDKIIPYISHF